MRAGRSKYIVILDHACVSEMKKRARVERGAGDVPVEPWNRDDEQMAVRHADASGGYVTENQHDENERHPRWQKRIRGSE